MSWTKDYKGFFSYNLTVPNVSSGGSADFKTHWFSYGDFGLPFSEFTLVVNYKNNSIGSVSQLMAMDMTVEWDFTNDDVADLTTSTEISVETQITNFVPNPDESIHVMVLDQDLLFPATDVNIALTNRFRFKFKFTCWTILGGYTDADKMALAIVPHNGG